MLKFIFFKAKIKRTCRESYNYSERRFRGFGCYLPAHNGARAGQPFIKRLAVSVVTLERCYHASILQDLTTELRGSFSCGSAR